jgi:hypothetical protein
VRVVGSVSRGWCGLCYRAAKSRNFVVPTLLGERGGEIWRCDMASADGTRRSERNRARTTSFMRENRESLLLRENPLWDGLMGAIGEAGEE